MLNEKEKHESYGMISASRYETSGEQVFFGSSIQHNGGIEITIAEGYVAREINNDYYGRGKVLTKIRMSASQFAELITNMNTSGVPCTLDYVDGKNREKPPFTNKRLQFEEEFSNDMKSLTRKMQNLTDAAEEILCRKKPPTIAEKDAILESLRSLRRDLGSNIPYVQSQFNEQMDKTVKEAKAEIDNFVTQTIMRLGVSKLDELKMLKSTVSPKENLLEDKENGN